MDAIQDVNPNSSNEAKFALAALLGSTMAQLKEIDRSIVGSSSNISSKLDVQRVLQSIQPVQQPQLPILQQPQPPILQQPQPPILQQHQPVQQPALSFAPQATVVNAGINVATPVVLQPTAEEDPNQLLFDFTKKITPDTVNDKLDIIINKLNKIIEFVEAT